MVISFENMPNMVAEILDRQKRIEIMLCKPIETPKPQRFDFNGALGYLKELGLTFSKSQMQKSAASGNIPCSKFNNRLVFEKSELDDWVQSRTVAVGNKSDEAALTLAQSANRKLRGSK